MGPKETDGNRSQRLIPKFSVGIECPIPKCFVSILLKAERKEEEVKIH